MKIYQFFSLLFFISSQGCSSSNPKAIEQKEITQMEISKPVGIWQDNIGLSIHQAKIEAKGGEITINTKGEWWWISEISVNEKIYADFSSTNLEAEQYTISKDCFTIKRIDKKTLSINLKKNPSNQKRIIVIGLQAGNYFDKITLTQSPK